MGGTALAPQRIIELKPRDYLHFDLTIPEEKRRAFSILPEQVCRHSFWPFLAFDRVERRIDFEHEPYWKISKKSRPIRYAAHSDSAIYSYYCALLSTPYEIFLAGQGLGDAALAYRANNGSNITFAKALFDEVRERGNCTVVCLDIKGFFDGLSHLNLEKRILELLQTSRLPMDWRKIFKRLTSYEYSEKSAVLAALTERKSPGRLCSAKQFRNEIRSLIQQNSSVHGIPQGSPLSGLLANVYMMDFDIGMNRYVVARGGSYRRYSDDLAFILPPAGDVDEMLLEIEARLESESLRINTDKTTITEFRTEDHQLLYSGTLLQYLGFTFDGSRILLRSSSIKRFYARMKAAIRIAVRAARHAGYPQGEIHRRSLVGKFTHWGDRRTFVQYAYRASRLMQSVAIRRQLRNHTKIFNGCFEKYISRYYKMGGEVTVVVRPPARSPPVRR